MKYNIMCFVSMLQLNCTCLHVFQLKTLMLTFVCISLATAMHVRHFLLADVRHLYPAIKFAAGLSADTIANVPRRLYISLLIKNGTPEFCDIKRYMKYLK